MVFTEKFSFDNPNCKDRAEGKMTCQEAQKKMGESMCNDVLYTVDLVKAPAAEIASDESPLADSGVNGDILRAEEEVESPKGREGDDDDDDERRRLEDSDDRLEVEIAPTLTGESDASVPSSDVLVVTRGSQYCPEFCNAVPQCKKANDYFKSIENSDVVTKDPELKGNSDDADDEDSEDAKAGLVADKVVNKTVDSSDAIVKDSADKDPVGKDDGPAGNVTKDIEIKGDTKDQLNTTKVEVFSDKGLSLDSAPLDPKVGEKESVEGVGEDSVSAGKIAVEPCEVDDPDFLYKGKAGNNCDYIAQKPEKCLKVQDGMKVGVSFCPLACNMKKECEEVKLSSGIAGSGDGDDVDKGFYKEEEKTDVGVIEVGLNSNSSDIIFKDASTGNVGKELVEKEDELGEKSSTELTCVDDPSFLYKGTPGYTCEYIGQSKPEKCDKLYNGTKVGVFSCPVSCLMVAECMEMSNISDHKIMDSGDTPVGGVSVAGSDGKDVFADTLKGPEKGSVGGSADPSGNANKTSTTVDVDDVKSPPPAANCKDDPSFLYKDKKGHTCKYVGEMKPDKCLKLLNGVEIGVSFCPESCKMVDKCLKSVVESAVFDKADNIATPLEEKADEATSVKGGSEEKVIDDGADESFEPSHGDLDTVKMGEDTMMTAVGTKSMADDIDSDDSIPGFGDDAKKPNEQNSNPDVGMSGGGYAGSPADEEMADHESFADKYNNDTLESNFDWNSIGSNGLGDFDEPKLGVEYNVSVFFGLFSSRSLSLAS
jgi:hypothetical protein